MKRLYPKGAQSRWSSSVKLPTVVSHTTCSTSPVLWLGWCLWMWPSSEWAPEAASSEAHRNTAGAQPQQRIRDAGRGNWTEKQCARLAVRCCEQIDVLHF